MRAIINTYLSLAACCVASFVVSSALSPDKKFDMVHVQNSTLAGGVAIGTSANLMLQPLGALSIGMNAGILSVIGYHKITVSEPHHHHDNKKFTLPTFPAYAQQKIQHTRHMRRSQFTRYAGNYGRSRRGRNGRFSYRKRLPYETVSGVPGDGGYGGRSWTATHSLDARRR